MPFCKGRKKRPALPDEESLDTLFGGRLKISQRKAGYRFSIDAVLLAHFVTVRGPERIVDLGAGNGIIALILAFLYPRASAVGVELQQMMVERAGRNVDLNGLNGRVEVIQGDVCSVEKIFPPQSCDVVVCNPPYRGAGSGRMNPDLEKRLARHEVKGNLADFLGAGSYLLRQGGRMALIYPAARSLDLLEGMHRQALEPKRLRLVYSFKGGSAALALVEGVKGAGSELTVMPPLVVYTREKKYTAEVKAILRG